MSNWAWLHGKDLTEAISQVMAYYPRDLTEDDAKSLWLCVRPGFYVWIELVAQADQIHGILHTAIHPDIQRRVYARPYLRGLRALCDQLRLDALHVVSGHGFEISEELCNYVERMGFHKTEVGYSLIPGRQS